MNAKDGGPAFPAEMAKPEFAERFTNERYSGMSLRDYFAAQALNAFLSAPTTDADDLFVGQRARSNPDMAAEWAYAQADAMLAERAT